MQSIRQYRRFGQDVLAQVEQERKKTAASSGEAIANGSTEQKPLSQEQFAKPSEPEHAHTDIEKAQSGHAGPLYNPAVEPEASDAESVEESAEHVEPFETRSQDNRPPSRSDNASLGRTISSRNSLRQVGTRLGESLSGVQVRRRQTNDGGDQNAKVFVVGFHGEDDPLNPHNWPRSVRWLATANVAMIGLIVGLASSIDSSILREASAEFGVSEVVESLATGLYLIGFGAGALTAGPISETVGRNPVYIATLALYMIFIMASGLAPNIGAQLAFRFLAGFFGSTPLTCAGGSLADLWNPLERVYTFPIFANAAFMGPILGPVIGGWIAEKLYWRWTEWITLIWSGAVLGVVVIWQPETFSGVILSWKAAHMRRITGDDRYAAPIEVRDESFLKRLLTALYRPFIMTVQEPIIVLITLYLTVIYIILFTFLDGYDYIFGMIHGTSTGITGTCFLGIGIGLFFASALVPLIYKWAKRDLTEIKERGGDKLPPEFRLWYSMLGGSIAIPLSLFWMGWTSYSTISIWSPLAASVFFGYGILTVFISSYQYIIDSYEVYAASALASVTLVRYIAAGGMTVVGIPFYQNLGVHWTLTILGAISALMAPLPYVFYVYGEKIRSHSKFAASPTKA